MNFQYHHGQTWKSCWQCITCTLKAHGLYYLWHPSPAPHLSRHKVLSQVSSTRDYASADDLQMRHTIETSVRVLVHCLNSYQAYLNKRLCQWVKLLQLIIGEWFAKMNIGSLQAYMIYKITMTNHNLVVTCPNYYIKLMSLPHQKDWLYQWSVWPVYACHNLWTFLIQACNPLQLLCSAETWK